MSNNGVHGFRGGIPVLLAGYGSGAALLSCTAPAWQTAWETAWSTLLRPGDAPGRLVGDVVVLLCTVMVAGALLWLSVGVLVCAVDTLRCPSGPGDEPPAGLLRPRIARALVAATVGTVVTAGGAGAQAAREPELPKALDRLTLPDRAHGGVRTHRVRTGDSLWSITADHLPRGVSAAAVACRWPRLHHLNRGRIGADPDLIQPGTVLRLPTWHLADPRSDR